jgi:KaiC/GvpD/RAD55 family RecA-like ATPase
MSKKVDAILSPDFVEEMLKLSFSNKAFAELVVENVDLSNFPRELGGCKAMLKVLSDTMKRTQNLATFGMVEMAFPNDKSVHEKVKEVKALKCPEYEAMVSQLETFIRRQTFVSTQREISDMYNSGAPEEAMVLLEKRMIEINAFSLTSRKQKFSRIYRDFHRNIGLAQIEAEDETRRQKLPFGISTLDDLTDGGLPRQDTALMIMRSGVGKSTFLKYVCWYNTAISHNHVLHIQLEGGEKEAVVKFDQMLANTTYAKIMRGDISEDTQKRLQAIINRAKTVNSDIDVYASEEMLDMTIGGLTEVIEDYKKEYGYYPDLVSIDSIDLLLTGENKKIDFDPNFIKYRLQKCAQRLKDIAKKYDCAVVTATQTGDVPIEVWNDPSRVITRQNTEGDRTLIKPFSFVFTGNITIEEGKQGIARIFCDKLRNYRNNGIIIRIPTNYENGFFYDLSRSVTEEKILDMSALEKLESKKSRKQNGDKAVGDKKVRVEVAPGVYSTKVESEGNIPVETTKEELNEQEMKNSLNAYLKGKRKN